VQDGRVPVVTGVNANASIGSSAHPEWLELDIAAGGLTLNGGTTFNGAGGALKATE